MGYYVSGSGSIFIQAANLGKAAKTLEKGIFKNANDNQMSVKDYLSWVGNGIDWKDVNSILGYCGMELNYDANGNADGVSYQSENYHSDDVMVFALLAPLMECYSFMDLSDESSNFWRWIFDKNFPNGCSCEDGMVVFPSDGSGHVENGDDGAYWKKEPLHLLPDTFVTLELRDGSQVSGTVYEITYDRQYHTVKTVDILLPNEQIRTISFEEILRRSN